ncbi:hypothetical protein M413DRAFT_197302 [Hebeloma cylindrosporum]|uniref:Uncharacterized protein n=1 Tax=Hebeloma cylindrosporum TaxID=76867 RepID=A0A0C3BRK9_HEBCY|nr:hypothetical protein M413DRAFT_197302 [Hebeloma cylindrosporum h7]
MAAQYRSSIGLTVQGSRVVGGRTSSCMYLYRLRLPVKSDTLIYRIIASHLPLHATLSTLLALGLTNHHISEIVLPLIHSRLILKNEEDALLVLQKLATDPLLGSIVRELRISSHLISRETTIEINLPMSSDEFPMSY